PPSLPRRQGTLPTLEAPVGDQGGRGALAAPIHQPKERHRARAAGWQVVDLVAALAADEQDRSASTIGCPDTRAGQLRKCPSRMGTMPAHRRRLDHDLPTGGIWMACAAPSVDGSATQRPTSAWTKRRPPRGRKRQAVDKKGQAHQAQTPVYQNARSSGNSTQASPSMRRGSRFPGDCAYEVASANHLPRLPGFFRRGRHGGTPRRTTAATSRGLPPGEAGAGTNR